MDISFPVISILIALIWLAMVFIGGVRAQRGSVNENFLCACATKSLQGLAAFGVVCHHLSQRPIFHAAANGGQPPSIELGAFEFVGFLFVALFFFASGYGLIKSLEAKPNYLNGFLRRRLSLVVVPFYVSNVFYIIWHVIQKTPMTGAEWAWKISGLVLLNDNAWFVPVIAIMYTAFYFVFRRCHADNFVTQNLESEANQKSAGRFSNAFALIFFVIIAQWAIFLFLKHFPWWLGPKDWWQNGDFDIWWKQPSALWFEGEWWVNSTIAFLFGMILAQHEKSFLEFWRNNYWKKFALLLITFLAVMWAGLWANSNISYWREFQGDNSTPPRLALLLIQAVQAIFFVLTIIVFMMKHFADNLVTRFFGNYSLEIYLVQAIPIRALGDSPYFKEVDVSIFSGKMRALLYIALVIAATVALAVVLKLISGTILKAMKKR